MILMYHGIVDAKLAPFIDPRFAITADAFAEQMRFLSHRRRVMPLSWLLDRLERGEIIAPGTVVITFDDGYKSVIDIAAPILRQYGLPGSVYLATGYITRQESQFVDVLYSTFNFRTRHELDFVLAGDTAVVADLRDPEATLRAFTTIERRLIVMNLEERQRVLGDVAAQLSPSQAPPRLTLDWSEVRRLGNDYDFELGIHTRDHTDVTACDLATATRAIGDSLDDMRREVGKTAAHFSFPFGRASHATRAAVVAAGLRSATLAGDADLVRRGADPFGLPRLEAPDNFRLLPFFTSGAYPELSLGLFRRA